MNNEISGENYFRHLRVINADISAGNELNVGNAFSAVTFSETSHASKASQDMILQVVTDFNFHYTIEGFV